MELHPVHVGSNPADGDIHYHRNSGGGMPKELDADEGLCALDAERLEDPHQISHCAGGIREIRRLSFEFVLLGIHKTPAFEM